MRFSSRLVSATVIVALAGVAHADPTTDAALEARLKALEQRVTELEHRLGVTEAEQAKQVQAQKAAAAAAAAAPAPAAAPAAAPAPAPRELWRDQSAWSQIRRGMTWSQVEGILGRPGSKTIGVFGDVWFYPDSSGGRVVFDRDSRVSAWTEPPGG